MAWEPERILLEPSGIPDLTHMVTHQNRELQLPVFMSHLHIHRILKTLTKNDCFCTDIETHVVCMYAVYYVRHPCPLNSKLASVTEFLHYLRRTVAKGPDLKLLKRFLQGLLSIAKYCSKLWKGDCCVSCCVWMRCRESVTEEISPLNPSNGADAKSAGLPKASWRALLGFLLALIPNRS